MLSGREVRKGSDKGKRDLLAVVPVFLLGKLVLGDFLCLVLPEEPDKARFYAEISEASNQSLPAVTLLHSKLV